MSKKKSVLFYLDNYTPSIKALSYEQKGMLFDAIISYAGGIADEPENMGLLSLALDGITAAIDRDNEKYVKACEKNKENGLRGGRPKKTQNNPVGLNGLDKKPNATQANPKEPDTDTDTIQIRYDTEKEEQEGPPPPVGGMTEEPEKKGPAKKAKEIEYPDWLDMESFEGFIEHRKEIKRPATPRAVQGLITKVDKVCLGDHYLQKQIIEKSIVNGWRSFFKLKDGEAVPDPTKEEGYMTPQQIHDNIHWDVIAKIKAGDL